MSKSKKYTSRELAEAHILSSGKSAREEKQADKEFSAFRGTRLAVMSPKEQLYSRIMQIKFSMEDYISSNSYNSNYTFGHFLNEYIHTLRKGKTDFSKEISIHPTQLSRLISNRDEPKERIFVRLEIHSHNAIPAVTWYRIREKQKVLYLLVADYFLN